VLSFKSEAQPERKIRHANAAPKSLFVSRGSYNTLVCDSAQAQKRGRGSTPAGNVVVVGDWRYPELVGKEGGDEIDVGDGFRAEHFDRDGNSLTVNIPGAYSDTLKVGGHGPDLTHKTSRRCFRQSHGCSDY